jgi:hypothetical protein
MQRRFLIEATQGMIPSLLLQNFSKNPDNCVETDRTSERFFDGNSISQKVKMMDCVERRVVAHSKLLVLTPLWLQHEDLRALLEFPGLHPFSFQKYSSDRRDSGPKKRFHKQNLNKLPPEPSEFSGAANGWLHLAD